jgi:hypothetical protein
MSVEQPSDRWRKTAERSAGNGMPQVPGFAILIADARSTHLPSDVKREAYCANRKATASIAIKPTINNNEIVAASLFALGLSFHDRRP